MAIKFGRQYELLVEGQDGRMITVELPFTIEFDIHRATLGSPNVAQFRVYNLKEEIRNQIRKNACDFGDIKLVKLRAGYGDNLPEIFSGNITQAWSVREGRDFITQIECFDAGTAFVNGVTNKQYPAGTPQRTVISDMISTGLPGVTLGAVGAYDGVLKRSNSYSGNTSELLFDVTGGGFFVDLGKGHALQTNECIETQSPTFIINSASGLLGTPLQEWTLARVEMIFEPQLNVGHKVYIDSSTGLNFNGEYKVLGIKHRGVISAAVSGSVVTTAEFFYSKQLEGVLSL